MVVTAGYQSELPVRFPWVVNFRFPYYEIYVGNSGGIRFVILVEDFNTGGPSSITVRKEYLFALQF